MDFTKMQGCGNDYIYVDCLTRKVEDASKLAIRLSNRNFGIGSDGLVLIEPSEAADVTMNMYNADGSRSEMCGNAIRCVGKYVYDRGIVDKTEMAIETLAGIKHLELHLEIEGKDCGKVKSVTVDMGAPILNPELIPVISKKNPVIREEILIDDQIYYMTCVSMGNPHAVIFVENTEELNLEELGPKFEHHPVFPNLVNVEFIQIIDRQHIKMRVWERGSGETLACGTGACASVVAGILEGRLDDKVNVELLGGHLDIYYDQVKDTVYMSGPAVEVFHGTIEE